MPELKVNCNLFDCRRFSKLEDQDYGPEVIRLNWGKKLKCITYTREYHNNKYNHISPHV